MFYRTIRMLENGVKPCYVFDGAAPKLKSGEVRSCFKSSCPLLAGISVADRLLVVCSCRSQLAKRKARREQAEGELKEAKDNGAGMLMGIVRTHRRIVLHPCHCTDNKEDVAKYQRRLVRVTKCAPCTVPPACVQISPL